MTDVTQSDPSSGDAPPTDAPSAEIADLSFDEALQELEKAAERLDSGDVPLEQALEVYERAVALFRHCSERLEDAEERLEVLTRDLDGRAKAEPLEIDDSIDD